MIGKSWSKGIKKNECTAKSRGLENERLAGKTGLDWCKEEKKRNEGEPQRGYFI